MHVRARVKRWYRYARSKGLVLSRILVHPSDAHRLPERSKGLPVVSMSTVVYLGDEPEFP